MKHKIHFDTFIEYVILSVPNMEKLSLMQRYDFNNGYGENTLLTHIRILCRTLISESTQTSLNMEMFKNIAENYDNITEEDIILLYKIIAQDSKRISFRVLTCFFINLKISSVVKIMGCLYKSDSPQCITYDINPIRNPIQFDSLKVDIPDLTENSISTYADNSPKTPPQSPINSKEHNIQSTTKVKTKIKMNQKFNTKKHALNGKKKRNNVKAKSSYCERFLIWTGCKSNKI